LGAADFFAAAAFFGAGFFAAAGFAEFWTGAGAGSVFGGGSAVAWCCEGNRIRLARPISEDLQGRATILIVLADPNPSGIPGSDIYQPLPHW